MPLVNDPERNAFPFIGAWFATLAVVDLASRILRLAYYSTTAVVNRLYWYFLEHWTLSISNMWGCRQRSRSMSDPDDSSHARVDNDIEPAILVYHESARSIVFRDHLRRAELNRQMSTGSDASSSSHSVVSIANFQPIIQPLPALELSSNDQFGALLEPMMDDQKDLTVAEHEVVQLIQTQHACVKTLKNSDWTNFLRRFWTPQKMHAHSPDLHDDVGPHGEFPFNSFVTSTSLLPQGGLKMRCYGSSKEYTTGVVFALPTKYEEGDTEDKAVVRTKTWAWPSGYAAKTEFNIDSRGQLINGREEALVSLSTMRRHNHDYVHKKDYKLGGRMIKGGLSLVPYNEVFLRVGGVGRLIDGVDIATGKSHRRTLSGGVGLPVALFVREATFGHLVSLLRTRARVSRLLGQENLDNIPLLLISPDRGVRVLTKRLESELMKTVSRSLNPFQNPHIAHRTKMDSNSQRDLQQKMEELLDLDSDNMKAILTPEERGRLAGGFGATDDSVAKLLMEAMQQDKEKQPQVTSNNDAGNHRLQDIVNEALAAAVRSGDYHTSRQLLILYTLVASKGNEIEGQDGLHVIDNGNNSARNRIRSLDGDDVNDLFCNAVVKINAVEGTVSMHKIPPPPPPPPLDTDRLRSATNSDGLLAVLGAAQVLKAMQDGGAQTRVMESVNAIDEWIEHGENSVSFRLASWRDQRAAQGDLKIAMEQNSDFLAFVSNKAISNRKAFASKLRAAATSSSFQDFSFLKAIHAIVSRMHSPCLRLELLQYILGLDNRYSVAHLARSVELAGTCLSISAAERTLSLETQQPFSEN